MATWWRVAGAKKWLRGRLPKVTWGYADVIEFLTNELQRYVDAYHGLLGEYKKERE